MRRRVSLVAVVGAGLGLAAVGVAGLMDDATQRATYATLSGQPISRQCGSCHGTEFSFWVSHPHSRFLVDCRKDARCIIARWGESASGWKKNVGQAFKKSDVALAFGVLQIQVYFRKDADGHRLLPAQWNIREKRWDALPADLQKIHRERRTWEQECAGCHVTGFNPADGSYQERGAACPSCHGDGAAHAGSGGVKGILRPSSLPANRRSEVCGRCHSRGRDKKTGRPYPVAFQPGASLEESFEVFVPAPGKTTEHFWPDGTERLPYMEYQGFKQSGHYRAGLACTTCHLAHGSDFPYNLRHKTTELCRSCHVDSSEKSPVHRAHPQGSATCVDCHMPLVNPSPNEAHIHTHTFRFLEPSRTLASGMPNSCTATCHAKKDARWAEATLKGWRGR